MKSCVMKHNCFINILTVRENKKSQGWTHWLLLAEKVQRRFPLLGRAIANWQGGKQTDSTEGQHILMIPVPCGCLIHGGTGSSWNLLLDWDI